LDLDIYAIAGILVTVVSIIVSVIVSYLVARHYGSRWVYERQALRDHAMAMVGDIQSWAHSTRGHAGVGLAYTEYGPEGQSGIRRSSTGFYVLDASDPPLRYYKQLKQHFDKGYPDIAKSWEQLKSETTECNRALADILNSVTPALNEIAKESSALSIDGPTLAEHIYKESEAQMKTGYMVDLKPAGVSWSESRFCVAVGSDKWVARFPSQEQANVARTKIDSLIEKIARSDSMKELLNQKAVYEKRQTALTDAIESVENGIRLGKLLRAKCDDCPT
jgi:hypothetical protein